MAIMGERGKGEYRVGDRIRIDQGLNGWYGVVVKAPEKEDLEIACIETGFPYTTHRRKNAEDISLVNSPDEFVRGLNEVVRSFQFEVESGYRNNQQGETSPEIQLRKLKGALAARRQLNVEFYIDKFSAGSRNQSPDSIVKQEPPAPESGLYVVAPTYSRDGQDLSRLKGLILNPRINPRSIHFSDRNIGTKVITPEMEAAELARLYLRFNNHVDPRADFTGFKAYEVPETVRSLIEISGTLIVSWDDSDSVFNCRAKLL